MKASREADPFHATAEDEPAVSPGMMPPRLRPEARKVLIVEDERRLRDMLLISVRDMGWDPTGAGSAESALKLMDQSAYAIAVVDLNLPGIDGLELCERIRQHWRSMQFIILTGFGNLDFARRAIRVEASDFLIKPCRMDELESAIQRAHARWIERTSGFAHAPAEAPPSELPVSPAPRNDGEAESQTVESIEQAERRLILAALARHNGSREAAAADLGISVRKLYYRLQQYQK